MDIMMPRMNSWDAARTIRAMNRPDAEIIPIIAMSANAFPEDIMDSRLAGMDIHLAKPLDEAKMINALKQCIAERSAVKLRNDLYRFAAANLRQHRIIPALRLKHRSGGSPRQEPP